MRKLLVVLACALLAAAALPAMGAADASDGTPTAGGFVSTHVKYVRYVPFEAGTATGSRIVGHYMYVTSWRSISIYDVSKPADPQLTSQIPLAASPGDPVEFENEDVATNGRVLVFSETIPRNVLRIYDVRDKANPVQIAEIDSSPVARYPAANHTMSCLLGCRWLWGSAGAVVDLRHPAHPKVMHHLWSHRLPGQNGHDVTEVKPGYVLTSTQPIMYLNAHHPLRPKLLALGVNQDKRFIHTVDWPGNAGDRFMLATGETNFKPRCGNTNGAFMTWDASRVGRTHTFRMLDEKRLPNGTYTDGKPAANALGCSSHWFEPNPTFDNGGVVAQGFYEHGTRFWRIGRHGAIHSAGYFEPFAGSTSAAHWVTNRIVYSIDYTRGFDVLRYTGRL